MATDAVREAALRLRANFHEAKAEGFYRNAWYCRMAKWDIEILVAGVLGPEPVVEPEPEPKRMISLSVSDAEGNVVWSGEVAEEDCEITPTGFTFPAAVEGFDEQREKSTLPNEPYLGGHFNPEDNTYTTGNGQRIGKIHPVAACSARVGGCVIHAPSDHHMRTWPTTYRTGGMFDIKGPHMERMCEHGVGHPDPDDLAFWKTQGEDYGVHGCDGCCTPPTAESLGQPFRDGRARVLQDDTPHVESA